MGGHAVPRRTWSERLKNDNSVRVWTVLGGVAGVGSLVLALTLVVMPHGSAATPPPAPSLFGANQDVSTATVPTGTSIVPAGTELPADDRTAGTTGAVLFNGQVHLTTGTGVDFEAGQTEGIPAEGPDGALDVYMTNYEDISVNGGDVYAYDGTEKDAEQSCRRETTDEQNGSTDVMMLARGQQICFLTSDGHVAWMRANTTTGDSDDAEMVANVRVWS